MKSMQKAVPSTSYLLISMYRMRYCDVIHSTWQKLFRFTAGVKKLRDNARKKTKIL